MSLRLAGVNHLSPSGASALIECPRRYWWRYKHGLGKDERSEAMAMGHGLAAALEFSDLQRGIADYHAARPQADGWTDPAMYEREGWAAEATITEAFTGYNARYSDPGIVREQTYLVRLPFKGRIIQARVDGCVPGHYLVEDKLRSASSMRPNALENEVRQGRQLTAEIYAHWRCTGEHLPVRFRVTKKCDPRKWKRLETHAEVINVICGHFATDGVFNEYTVVRTEQQLAEFEEEFRGLITQADDVLGSHSPAGARNEKACHAYGRVCPALAACQGVVHWKNLVPKKDGDT
jgi:PD-(D/E)XK nuclease superfamily